jgi:hypothetical protein
MQNWEELEEIFEKLLRPLQSRNARHIFLILRGSETEYLTTYDMQHKLKEQGNTLSKVELNNWLNALLEVGLVQKASERGKPTTRPYNKRYTFDLWKLTQKGRETSYMLEVFRGNIPTHTIERIIEKPIERKVEIPKLPELSETKFEDLNKLRILHVHLALLKTLHEEGSVDLWSLSRIVGFTPETIIEFIENHSISDTNTLYYLEEIPMDFKGKILQTVGLSPKKNHSVSLSFKGKKLAETISSL